MRTKVYLTAIVVVLALAIPAAAQDEGQLAERIRKEIVKTPQYGVFDALAFELDGSELTLTGYASRPSLKSAVEKRVKGIEGIELVVNKIEVLPTSRNDETIRARTYAAIYGHPTLSRYNPGGGPTPRLGGARGARRRAQLGISSDPPPGPHPISIIVNNGDVTLVGVVATEQDKQVAGIQANSVSGVFSVTNNLEVEKK